MKSNTEDRNERTDKTSSESGSYLVCAGATCSCSEALIPVPVKLKITSQQKIFINDSQLVATVQDNNMAIAVAPFVQCKQSPKTGKPCEYSPSSSWEWSPDVGTIHPEIKGMKILTENAFLKCPKIPAAKITIVTHGQIIDVADDAIEELDEPIALAILCLYDKIEKQPENNTIPRVQSIQVGAYKSKQGPVVSVPIRTKSPYVFTANYGNDALYCYWYLKPKKENEKIPLKYDPAEGLLYKQIGNKIALQINEEGNYYIEGFGQLLIKNKSKERMFADCTLLLEAQKNTFKKIKISPAPIQKAQADKIEVWYNQSYTIGLETLFELSDSEKETLSISIEDSDRNLIKQYAYCQAIPLADDQVIGSAEQINVLDIEEKIAEDYQPIPVETPFLIDGISSFKLSNLNEGIYYVRVNILDEPEKEYTFYAIANKLEKAIKSADIPSSHQIRPNTKVKLVAKLMNANDKKKVTWYINNIKQENQQETALTYSFSSLGKHKIYASLLEFGLLRSKTDVYTVEVLKNAVKAITTAPANKEYPVGTTLEFKAETVFAKILAENDEGIIWKLSCTKEGARIKGTGAVKILSEQHSELMLSADYLQLGEPKNTENTLKVKFTQVGEFELRAAIGKSKDIKGLPIKIIYAHIEAWKFVDSQQQARKNVGWGQSFAIYLKVKGWEGKSISLQLWYDNRSKFTKSRFKKVDCDVLKNKQVVKADGSCHVQIEGDSFWKSFEKAISWENKDFRFFFTAFDVESICDNSNAKTEETLPGHIFPKAVANTYAHIPNQTVYKGHFANSDGSLLTDIIEYKDQAKIVVWIENKKGDAYLENKYHVYLHENRTGEDPNPIVIAQKFDKEGKIEYPIPMGLLKSTKEKEHPKHRPRFFYFRLEIVGGRFSRDKFVYTYPEDYGINRKNDAHIIDLSKDDYRAEEMPAPLWRVPIFFDRVDKIWPENLHPFELKKKEEEERAVATQQHNKPSDDQKRQAETKNKKAKEENAAKIERGKNYHYQLKIAEDADLQRSRYSNTGKRIGTAIGGSPKHNSQDCPRCKAAIRGTKADWEAAGGNPHEAVLETIFPKASVPVLKKVADTYTKHMSQLDMATCWQKAHFFAQVAIETGYKLDLKTGENMGYKGYLFLDTFPSRFFKGKKIKGPWVSDVDPNALYKHTDNRVFKSKEAQDKAIEIYKMGYGEPRNIALATYVYGDGNGKLLGNVQKGDGWRFRGSGLIQLTGRSNFEKVYAKIKGIRPESILTDSGADKVRTDLELAVLAGMGYFLAFGINEKANGAESETALRAICLLVGESTRHEGSESHDLKIKFFKEKSAVLFKTSECEWGGLSETLDGNMNQYRIDIDLFNFKKIIEKEASKQYQYLIYNKDILIKTYTLEKNDFGLLPFPETGDNWGRFGSRDAGGDNWIDEKVCAALLGYFYSLPLNNFHNTLYYNDINAHDGRNIGHKGHQRGNDIDLRYPGSRNTAGEVLWAEAMKNTKYNNSEKKFQEDVELVLKIATNWGFNTNYAYKSDIKYTKGIATSVHQNHYHLGYR